MKFRDFLCLLFLILISTPAISQSSEQVDSTQLIATDDASLKDYDPDANSNYSNVEIHGRQNKRKIAIIKFDISTLINTPEVIDAKLKIHTTSFSDEVSISAFKTNTVNWEESSVTWNNGPTRGELIEEVNFTSNNTTYEFDITDYIHEKVQLGDTYITIWLEDTNLVDRPLEFKGHTRSSENPELSVTVNGILPGKINLNVGGETGTVDSGLDVPLSESYSKNDNSDVVDGDGNPYRANNLH